MKIVQLSGGLGNQLFQYSFGVHLHQIQKEEIYYLYNHDANVTPRSLELHQLGISPKLINSVQLNELQYESNKLIRHLREKTGLANYLKLREDSGTEITQNQDPRHQIYIGYWQDYRYVQSSQPQLLKSLQKTSLSPRSQNFLSSVEQNTSVAIHIRRGDYVTNSKVSQVLKALPLSYYITAIELLKRKITQPHFYVFSNDAQWVHQHFPKYIDYDYVDWNTGSYSYQDMILMSKCSHQIIANSSFSWWGAWLGKKQDQIVISPRQWFAPETDIDTKDLIPNDWYQI